MNTMPSLATMEHLRKVYAEIIAARPLHFSDHLIPILLPRVTKHDEEQCDLFCEHLHYWPKGHDLIARPEEILAHGNSMNDECDRQFKAELVALRLRFAIDCCEDYPDLINDEFSFNGNVADEIQVLVRQAWHLKWSMWIFHRFAGLYLPTDKTTGDGNTG